VRFAFASTVPASSWMLRKLTLNVLCVSSVSTTETVTQRNSQLSEQRSKGAEMSSVAEMSSLVREVADFAAPSPNWKDRVNAAARVLQLPFGRAKAHYYGEARRVDAEEMDRAREAAEQLREAKLRRKAAEHLAWLNTSIEHLRSVDPEFHSLDVAGLERAVARLGAQCGAVADPSTAEGD
jgi:hypothetical protein